MKRLTRRDQLRFYAFGAKSCRVEKESRKETGQECTDSLRRRGHLRRTTESTAGKGIVVFGGGELATSLFQAHLIDEVVLNVHPIILGSGIPLFQQMKRQIDLELLKAKRLKNGCIVLSYRIQR